MTPMSAARSITVGSDVVMQPKASDIYKMWADYEKDAAAYPELSRIRDDTGDGILRHNDHQFRFRGGGDGSVGPRTIRTGKGDLVFRGKV